MKRILVLFLMLWFMLQSGLAQAHGAMEDVHRMAHAAADQAHEKAPDTHAGESGEICGVAHCCHSAGVLVSRMAGFAVAPTSPGPASFKSLPLRTPPPDIERPKWSAATPAVAGLHS